MEILVEGARCCEGFKQGKGGFGFTLLGELPSEHRYDGGVLEQINIDAESSGRAEPYHIVTECDRCRTDHAPDAVQDLVQVVRCPLRFGFGPQQVHHDLAVQPVPGRESEQFSQAFWPFAAASDLLPAVRRP